MASSAVSSALAGPAHRAGRRPRLAGLLTRTCLLTRERLLQSRGLLHRLRLHLLGHRHQVCRTLAGGGRLAADGLPGRGRLLLIPVEDAHVLAPFRVGRAQEARRS